MTKGSYNLNVAAKLMVLVHHILPSLAIAATAGANLMRIPAERVLLFHRVVPKYLQLVTSSNYYHSCPRQNCS